MSDFTETFQEQGYVVLENRFAAPEIGNFVQEINRLVALPAQRPGGPIFRSMPTYGLELNPRGVWMIENLMNAGLEWLELWADPRLLQPVTSVIGSNVDVFCGFARLKCPSGVGHQNWHRDCWNDYCGGLATVSTLVYLSDTTASGGATEVIPGSHRIPDRLIRSNKAFRVISKKAIPVEVKAGDMVLLNSHTFHRAGNNLSTDIKYSLIFVYKQAGEYRRTPYYNTFFGFPIHRMETEMTDSANEQTSRKLEILLGLLDKARSARQIASYLRLKDPVAYLTWGGTKGLCNLLVQGVKCGRLTVKFGNFECRT